MSYEDDFFIDGKRVAIVGSREWKVILDDNGNTIGQNLEDIWEFVGSLPPDVTIISGGARGVDSAAVDAAKHFGMAYKVWKADWNKYGKSAGFIRNLEIVRDSDIIIAFWDGYSKGTNHVITQAKLQGRKYIVITP